MVDRRIPIGPDPAASSVATGGAVVDVTSASAATTSLDDGGATSIAVDAGPSDGGDEVTSASVVPAPVDGGAAASVATAASLDESVALSASVDAGLAVEIEAAVSAPTEHVGGAVVFPVDEFATLVADHLVVGAEQQPGRRPGGPRG